MSVSAEELEELYESVIVAHYESPRHRGTLEDPKLSHSERNPICGDHVQLEASIDGDRLDRLRFEAHGCIISQAAASLLCEYAEGKRLVDLQSLTADEMLKLLQVPLMPRRVPCALLPFRALKAIVYCSQGQPSLRR